MKLKPVKDSSQLIQKAFFSFVVNTCFVQSLSIFLSISFILGIGCLCIVGVFYHDRGVRVHDRTPSAAVARLRGRCHHDRRAQTPPVQVHRSVTLTVAN